VLFQSEIFGQNITMKVPFSSEPIMGSIEDLVPYDSVVIMLAGVYIPSVDFCTGYISISRTSCKYPSQ
jgi:hypothetical protein